MTTRTLNQALLFRLLVFSLHGSAAAQQPQKPWTFQISDTAE
jgi:hypothetical protein